MLLLAVPLTIGFDTVFPGRAEVVIHLLLATGTLLIGVSVFDFSTPSWLTGTAFGAACVLAAIFFAQGLAALTLNDTLNKIAFSQAIGGWTEAVTLSMVMAWFIAVARVKCGGVTMLIGALSAATTIGLSAWGVLAAPPGEAPGWLRLVVLVPIAWFVFVSTRSLSTFESRRRCRTERRPLQRAE